MLLSNGVKGVQALLRDKRVWGRDGVGEAEALNGGEGRLASKAKTLSQIAHDDTRKY